jgi:CRP/FNR family cyclic AMP-dependent transcriptional regulator
MSESPLEPLRRMAVFGGLSADTLTMILDQSQLCRTAAGEYFFREHDEANSLYVIQYGSVIVEKDWHGSPVPVAKLGAGDCFGELSLLDLQPRSAAVRAESACETIRISISQLHDLYRQDLEQYTIIMMNLGREVSRRFRVTSQKLFEMQQNK